MRADRPISLDAETWKSLMRSAIHLFKDAEDRGFGPPPFWFGGGTVLMLRLKHRLSKDIDFFGFDAQWLPILSPRLNETAASFTQDYDEQANSIKLRLPHGDIDFVIAADIVRDLVRTEETFEGQVLAVDPTSEILAKKLFYRAASFKPRDVYDLSAAIDLDLDSAERAVQAAFTKTDILTRRLDQMRSMDGSELVASIVPYDGRLDHADDMVRKVKAFVDRPRERPDPPASRKTRPESHDAAAAEASDEQD